MLQLGGTMYALAMGWFSQWDAYVKGHNLDAPGPIDNTSLTTGDPNLTLGKYSCHIICFMLALCHCLGKGYQWR